MEVYKVFKLTQRSKWEVSNYGNVKCNNESYKLKTNNSGYLMFGHYLLHRAVAELFLPNPDNKPEVDHINTIKSDNKVENLRWCSHKENMNNPLSIINNSNGQTWQKGEDNPMYGKTHSKETKIKMSEVKKGNNYRKGKKASDETKKRISLSRAGKHLVLCEDGKKHFI